jgi:hypothetical protein
MPGILPPADTDDLASLHGQLTRLEAIARRRGRAIQALGVTAAALLAFGVLTSHGLVEARRMLVACRTSIDPSTRTLTALASAHESPPHRMPQHPAGRLRSAHGAPVQRPDC